MNIELSKQECMTLIRALFEHKNRLRQTVKDCETAVHPEMHNATEHFRHELIKTESLFKKIVDENKDILNLNI